MSAPEDLIYGRFDWSESNRLMMALGEAPPPLTLADLARAKATMGEPKAHPVVVFHSPQDFSSFAKKQPYTPGVTWSYDGPECIIDPEIATEPGKMVCSDDPKTVAMIKAKHNERLRRLAEEAEREARADALPE